MTDQIDLHRRLQERITDALEEFAGEYADLGLPSVGEWVLLVAIDDATDPRGGTLAYSHAPCQWKYRTVGLLEEGIDQVRRHSQEDE